MFSKAELTVIAIIVIVLASLCHCAPVGKVAHNESEVTVQPPPSCPVVVIKQVECYRRKKLIITAFVTSLLDLDTQDKVECHVK